MDGDRRRYKICQPCNKVVLVYGEQKKGDELCPHTFTSREAITPTVYYENAKGEIWSGPDANTPCPFAGYERREVQAHEIRKFERVLNRKMQDQHREQLERQREVSEHHAAARAQARKEMDADVLRESEGWDREHRELLHYAMDHRDEPNFSRNFDPEMHIGAFS